MKHLISENSRVHLTLASLCAVLAFCLFLGNASLSAQNKGNASYQVTGTVRTEGGESVIGAGVVVKGTLNGTTTDIDGKFSLKVPSESTILQISFMGYVTEDVPLNGRNNIVVTMKEDKNLLEEVVVVGYGTVKKKDLTGSIANVDGKHLADMQSTSLAQALQGSMPGVQVTRSSGLPGASATIRVRGVTTIGDSDPLVIVDGVQVGSMNDVDVDAVENITVLKDAASASIYGARASCRCHPYHNQKSQTRHNESWNIMVLMASLPGPRLLRWCLLPDIWRCLMKSPGTTAAISQVMNILYIHAIISTTMLPECHQS
jgi:hypothetical protein